MKDPNVSAYFSSLGKRTSPAKAAAARANGAKLIAKLTQAKQPEHVTEPRVIVVGPPKELIPAPQTPIAPPTKTLPTIGSQVQSLRRS